MDPRMRHLRSGLPPEIPQEPPKEDPVARSTRCKSMKITDEVVERSKLKYGGLQEFVQPRSFLGHKDEG